MMRIITKRRIHDFITAYPNADVAGREWYVKSKNADWESLHDIKQTFNSVDYVGNDRYVFNLSGNKFRLVAIVRFRLKTIYIRFIGTHKDYDRITDIKNI